jgi:hypothetical protein
LPLLSVQFAFRGVIPGQESPKQLFEEEIYCDGLFSSKPKHIQGDLVHLPSHSLHLLRFAAPGAVLWRVHALHRGAVNAGCIDWHLHLEDGGFFWSGALDRL